MTQPAQQGLSAIAEHALDAVRDACRTARVLVIVMPSDPTDTDRVIGVRNMTKVQAIRELERAGAELYSELGISQGEGPTHEH